MAVEGKGHKSFHPKDERRMYGDLAWAWQIISPPEDYVPESELFWKTVNERSRIPAKTLLHLGCGGGHNDSALKMHFEITGVDLSEEMLSLAKRLNPEVTYLRGDMRTVRLGRMFDAVFILDSIAYMTTAEDLRAAFATAFTHLNDGGVFLTVAEITRERFRQNLTTSSTKSRGDVGVTLVENDYDPDTTDTEYESTFVYLIRRGGKLEIHYDRHLTGVFPLKTWSSLLEEVGFEVEQSVFEFPGLPERERCPMFVCVRP